MTPESKFQHSLIERLKEEFPDCVILKNNAGYKKNIPDLAVFWKSHYAFLEVKASEKDHLKSLKDPGRKNQKIFVDKFREWSYSSFVYPENVDQVLREMREVFV